MTRLTAQSATPAVRAWLRQTRPARILHVFEHVVNLIAGDDVLSLVTPNIGNGPFNAVLPAGDFTRHVTASDPVRVAPGAVTVGDLVIDFASAALWNPRPDWGQLRAQRQRLRAHAPVIRAVLQRHAPADSLAHLVIDLPAPPSGFAAHTVDAARQHWQRLYRGALALDRAACEAGAARLAGLGGGLTPAGDDWLVGCALAAQLGLPSPPAAALILQAVRQAAPGTNALSSCWLRAAVDGACGEHWHAFFARCVQADERAVFEAASAIARQGHSSGADALAGYLALVGAE